MKEAKPLSPDSPFMQLCGIGVKRLEPGDVECTMTVTESLNNRQGMLHGGALATLADCTAGVATWQVVDPDKVALTTDFNLTCLRAASTGDRLLATGKLVHRGRRFMRVDVEVYLEAQPAKLVAKAGVSFMVVEKPV
jgi:uncharacterized protein (TIGR00369 family)